MTPYYTPKSHGREYRRNIGKRSQPATDAQRIASIQARIDSLMEERAKVGEDAYPYYDNQIAFCQGRLDEAMEAQNA